MRLKPSCDIELPALPIDADEIEGPLTNDQLARIAVSFVIVVNYLNELKVRCGD